MITNPDIDDLDESRGHDTTKVDLHTPRQYKGTNNNHLNRCLRDEKLSCGGRQPPHSINSSLHQQQQQHVTRTHHLPQHLKPLKLRENIDQNVDCHNDVDSLSSSARELDGKMSGLQAAATKTALLVNGTAIRNSIRRGEIVTTEETEDDDQYSHWIFRRHVGFYTSEGRKTYLHDPPTSSVGAINGKYMNRTCGDLQSRLKNSLLSAIEATTTRPNECNTEKSELLQQLNHLRRQRRQIERSVAPTVYQHMSEWSCRLSSSQQSYINALSTLESVRARKKWADEELRATSKCHVLGDVFLIWHRGPFGTINGFRLGKSAMTMTGLVIRNGCHDDGRPLKGGGSSVLSWISSNNTGPITSNAPKNTNASTTNPNAIPDKVQVQWNEVNSALGQVLFLLYTLQSLPQSGISFRKHVLQPCGSSSKIGIVKKQPLASSSTALSPGKHPIERRTITALAAYNDSVRIDTMKSASDDPSSAPSSQSSHPPPALYIPGDVTWYNLYHYEENGSLLSIGYYARRNFNIALEGLLYCIAEAFIVVEDRDMALAAPYTMIIGGLIVGKDVHANEGAVGGAKKSEATVGGLPIAYDPTKGEEWTMACKYLLTNLKWLVAYAAKHIDSPNPSSPRS